MARTKIVATIGPSSNNPGTIQQMMTAGMNVARVNFSHGDHQSHIEVVKMLRHVAAAEGRPLAILGDLQGPKIRLGHVKTGGVRLAVGDEVVLTSQRGQPAMIHLPHPDLIQVLNPGSRLIIGDGEVELMVAEKQTDALRCTVTVAGLLESRKGVNAPGTDLGISSLTEKDRMDMQLICDLKLDYVALSFVRTAVDVLDLRKLLRDQGHNIPIIAKIEKSEAINCLEEIRDAADGMMVARGDLGIEMPPQEVPILQKQIIRCCNEVGKPVITATQMLQSMVEHPRPTRAEASDVANAILDGADAVMLSGETASGKFPVEAVLMMKQISEITEKEFPYDLWRDRRHNTADMSVTEAISAASCDVADQIDANVIVSTTMSGHTAQQIARHRPFTPILAVTPAPETQRRLALVWGVECMLVDYFEDTDGMVALTIASLRQVGLRQGAKIVITAGVPFGQQEQTNLIQVHEIQPQIGE